MGSILYATSNTLELKFKLSWLCAPLQPLLPPYVHILCPVCQPHNSHHPLYILGFPWCQTFAYDMLNLPTLCLVNFSNTPVGGKAACKTSLCILNSNHQQRRIKGWSTDQPGQRKEKIIRNMRLERNLALIHYGAYKMSCACCQT